MGCSLSSASDKGEDTRVKLSTPVDAPQHKVILVGDISVGKSSLVQRLLGKGFREEHVSTIGTAFASVTMDIQEGKPPMLMHVWDTAGEERYRSMSRFFFRGTNVGILVFDVTSAESLARLKGWHDDILRAAPEALFIVVANKIDCTDAIGSISIDEGQAYANEIHAKFSETSAKTDKGVTEMFRSAALLCLSDTPRSQNIEARDVSPILVNQ